MEVSLTHAVPFTSYIHPSVSFLKSKSCNNGDKSKVWKSRKLSLTITSSIKHVRDPSLDQHVVKQNKIRFVQKLKTLLLSKPKHYMPLHILNKCRSYLSLSKPRSIITMIRRYPTIFELFTIPLPPTPFNATKSLPQLCVRLTPAAASLASEESKLKTAMSNSLANKLQKLLMLSSHNKLLLSKLVHIGPDLGLPSNFRSRLCNEYPEKFRTVDTSYGRALELVSCDISLANHLPNPDVKPLGLIVDRPLKFNRLRLRNGRNIKRHHEDFLINFREIKDVCPYRTQVEEFSKVSIESEKRACDVVREILGMTVEKRTLVDHLTHFRKEFGLSNRLRAMLLRHPELFYVSVKGQRDSVFLVEGYDEKGTLLKKDNSSVIKDLLLDLVKQGKWMRREIRNDVINGFSDGTTLITEDHDSFIETDDDDDDVDGLDDLFESDGYDSENSDNEDEEDASIESLHLANGDEFWSTKDGRCLEPW
ncbi:protein WHAT'S THIS FACTOR 1 homolog, chloroplastic [Rutidosis leptorrhynchoides]|uniref:protein WHAT'S THIS FACTOR 1 homolog, chloroplastic n=1 Tax=Rutidosis leptorrhynchoides TaxID=125765 RepID=UPI003A990F1C